MSYCVIRPRRGTPKEWIKANPILIEGEIGIETPENGVGKGLCNIKIGDGVTPWNDLEYAIIGKNKSHFYETSGTDLHLLTAKGGIKLTGVAGGYTFQESTPSMTAPVTIKQVRSPLNIRCSNKNILIPVGESSSKNGIDFICQEDNSYKVSGTATAYAFYKVGEFKTVEGESYIISGCPEGGDILTKYFMISQTDNNIYDMGDGVLFTATKTEARPLHIGVRQNYTANDLIFKPMVRLAKVVNSEYVKFKRVTIPITLPDILGAGDYIYEENDEIYLSKSTMTRKLTGSENWTLSGTVDSGALSRFIYNPGDTTKDSTALCSHLPLRVGMGNPCFYVNTDGIYLDLPADVFPNLNSLRTWLSSDNVEVTYKLANPITRNISASIGDGYFNIKSYEDYTNLVAVTDRPLELSVMYSDNDIGAMLIANGNRDSIINKRLLALEGYV